MQGSQIFTRAIGRSIEGRELIVEANFDLAVEPPRGLTLLIGGQHDESATARLVESSAPRAPRRRFAACRNSRWQT
jgi:hypothetical protein